MRDIIYTPAESHAKPFERTCVAVLHARAVARWRREVVIVTFKSARDRKRPAADSGGFRRQTVVVAVNSVTSRG